MMYLFTGLPGASKTLNAIKFVNEDDKFCVWIPDPKDPKKSIIKLDENGKKVRRPVYYHNINQLSLPWNKLTDNDAKAPYDIEKGAVIFYDECQDIFPVLPSSKSGNAPERYTYMNRHRHNGHDIILVTQHPKNLNTQLRRLINEHHHLKRRFGTETVTKFTYMKCFDEPEDHFAKKEAQISTIEFDKKYYDVYKSAEVHTHKKTVPYSKYIKFGGLVFAVIAAIAFFVYLMFKLAANRLGDDEVEIEIEPSNNQSAQNNLYSGAKDYLDDYNYLHTPRLKSFPHTAPIYDELTAPVSFPRTAACVVITDTCTCYTQQATKLQTEDSICRSIVANGYFDSSIPDVRTNDDRRSEKRDYAYSKKPQSSRSILIPHTSKF